MKDFYLSDCPKLENKTITSYFVVASKQVKSKKDGAPYLALTLSDRTGQIDAKMWDNVAEPMETVAQDDFVKVRGLLNKYNGKFQLTVHQIKRADDLDVDFTDFLPTTKCNVDELWAKVRGFVESFNDPYLKTLLKTFMADEEIVRRYKTAPAAKALHHASIGGLLEHVVSLMTLCDLVLRNYPEVNRDLVLTGAFLHDIGKVHELAYARSFSYTTEGQLVGHINIGLEMLHEKLRHLPGFPPELKVLVEHLIISHHGEYEFGSPKLPMFAEAVLLHHCDNLDSKMEAMRAQFEREANNDGAWTTYNPSLQRTLLNTTKYLAPKQKAAAATESE